MTNADMVAEYLAWLSAKHRTTSTRYDYRQRLVTLLDWIGPTPLAAVEVSQLRGWLRRQRRAGVQPSAATVKKEIAVCRSLWRYLTARGLVDSDPTGELLLDAPTVRNVNPKPVPDGDWRAVWDADLDDGWRVALGLGWYCGLRRAEITALVPSQVQGEQLVGIRRKGGDQHVLHWWSCEALLCDRLPSLAGPSGVFGQAIVRLAADRRHKRTLLPWGDLVDPTKVTRHTHPQPHDGWINPNQYNARLRHLLDGQQIARFTPHQLRHSFCTNLLACGVPIQVVSRLAGHSSIQVTMRYVQTAIDPLADYLTSSDHVPIVPRWGTESVAT